MEKIIETIYTPTIKTILIIFLANFINAAYCAWLANNSTLFCFRFCASYVINSCCVQVFLNRPHFCIGKKNRNAIKFRQNIFFKRVEYFNWGTFWKFKEEKRRYNNNSCEIRLFLLFLGSEWVVGCIAPIWKEELSVISKTIAKQWLKLRN